MGRTESLSVSWPQALAWRMERQLLEPTGALPAEDVVRRLGAIKAQPAETAELAIAVRQREPQPGEIAAALEAGRLIKTFAYRGATHLLTPEEGAATLALRASSKMWELPSWQTYYRLRPADWPAFLDATREALADGPLTFDEFGAVITAQPRYRHLESVFRERNWTLIKALAWNGVLCLGPTNGRATLLLLERNPYWKGLSDVDEAGTSAVASYLGAYGPATADHLRYWLGSGLGVGGKGIRSWIARLGDRLAKIDLDGTPAMLMRDDLGALVAARASSAVRLLPAYDPWVIGPGTSDAHVVPTARRNVFSRPANIVLAGGVVSGTWSVAGDLCHVTWFEEIGKAPAKAIETEVARLGKVVGKPLNAIIHKAGS